MCAAIVKICAAAFEHIFLCVWLLLRIYRIFKKRTTDPESIKKNV